MHICTDDPVFSVAGQNEFLRALRFWNDATSVFGLRMAIARKRQVGPCLTRLGFSFYCLMGIVTIAPEKISRAHEVIQSTFTGAAVTLDQHRRFLGLLKHVLLFVGGGRIWMCGLYGATSSHAFVAGRRRPKCFSDPPSSRPSSAERPAAAYPAARRLATQRPTSKSPRPDALRLSAHWRLAT